MDQREVVKNALDRKRRNETLERAIGKAVRRNGGTYEDYIGIMSRIREARDSENLTLLEAARKFAGEG